MESILSVLTALCPHSRFSSSTKTFLIAYPICREQRIFRMWEKRVVKHFFFSTALHHHSTGGRDNMHAWEWATHTTAELGGRPTTNRPKMMVRYQNQFLVRVLEPLRMFLHNDIAVVAVAKNTFVYCRTKNKMVKSEGEWRRTWTKWMWKGNGQQTHCALIKWIRWLLSINSFDVHLCAVLSWAVRSRRQLPHNSNMQWENLMQKKKQQKKKSTTHVTRNINCKYMLCCL